MEPIALILMHIKACIDLGSHTPGAARTQAAPASPQDPDHQQDGHGEKHRPTEDQRVREEVPARVRHQRAEPRTVLGLRDCLSMAQDLTQVPAVAT